MKIAIIDNYDSFTYNLFHIVRSLGHDVTVIRNDQFKMDELDAFDRIILSPGPGIPCEAGLLLDVIRTYSGQKPILGVCLGLQAIGEVFGCSLQNLDKVYHGVSTPICVISDDILFDGLSREMDVGRYHSWVINRDSVPDCLEVTSISDDGEIMSIRHRELDVRGVQFHPESVLTPNGYEIIRNWLRE